jgi:SAM-dependent methyltransferase
MNLCQLVTLRNQLQKAYDSSVIADEIDKNYQRLINLSDTNDTEIQQQLTLVADDHRNIKQYLDSTASNIETLLHTVQSKIDQLATKLFTENYNLELNCPDTQHARNVRQLQREEQFENSLIQRINLHSGWQYPALEIGCRDGEWTKYLVASDPLYIADFFEEFLDTSLQQFPELYRGRVRKYLIQDYCKIHNLPKNTFGFIFSYNFFNYLSLDSIKQILSQSMDWLRPGGKIVFTYNNCDIPAAAGYAENSFMTYVPKTILQPMAESLGFETTFSFDTDPAFSIIEFKKSGQLQSIKLAQTFGEIKAIKLAQTFGEIKVKN